MCKTLIILHRDWTFDNNGSDRYKCGFYDDKTQPPDQHKNWKRTLMSRSSPRLTNVLNSNFDYIAAYAMFLPHPPPGNDPKEWKRGFKQDLNNFMDKVLHPDFLARY